MKRKSLVFVTLLLVLVLAFALIACGGVEAPKVETIEVEFCRDISLEDVALPEGFSWRNGLEKLEIGTMDHDAIYTKDGKSIDTKVSVKVNPAKTMLEEEESMDYVERVLCTDAYKASGEMYESTTYDQYVMILARSHRGIKPAIKDAYIARVKDLLAKDGYLDKTTNMLTKTVTGAWGPSVVDYTTNVTMTLLALGESTVVNGIDIAAPFYSADFAVQSYAYALNNSLNVVKNLTIPATYKTADGVEHTSTTTVDKVVNALLATQKEGGGWETANMDYSKDPAEFLGMVLDVDTTTMAIMALGDIEGNAEAQKAIKAGIADIKSHILDSGSIDYFLASNISGTSTAITALASQGIDAKIIVNASTKKSLLDYQSTMRIKEGDSKGAYGSEWSNGYSDDFATKDSLVALVSYNRYMRGENTFFSMR